MNDYALGMLIIAILAVILGSVMFYLGNTPLGYINMIIASFAAITAAIMQVLD